MAGPLSADLTRIREMLEDLENEVEDLEEENERLEKENATLESQLDDLDDPDAPDPHALARLERVIHHLLHHTGVYDLADLKDAAINAGLEP